MRMAGETWVAQWYGGEARRRRGCRSWEEEEWLRGERVWMGFLGCGREPTGERKREMLDEGDAVVFSDACVLGRGGVVVGLAVEEKGERERRRRQMREMEEGGD